jgi:hypothetical protein
MAVAKRAQLDFGFAESTPPLVDRVPPLGVAPEKSLHRALTDPGRHSGFLPIAEEAVQASPGDGNVLLQAATAALLDDHPERALVFLKRFSKRYVPVPTYSLLYALALEQDNKRAAARVVLDHHRLTEPFEALLCFPGGWARRDWLYGHLGNILGRDLSRRGGRRRGTAAHQSKASQSASSSAAPKPKAQSKPARKAAPGTSPAPPVKKQIPPSVTPADAPSSPVPDEAQRDLRGLPRIDIDIPFTVQIDLAPLLAAAAGAPETDGAWYGLRERFAHLGLARGFDELMCLPHLTGIETFWYQVETVRKVLKQFRGRVLLADEVGLGKTIEAGMVLKEYLLRGMVESVLVLTPASLVGQWREELETKFDIACATTHDALMRSDPDRFWRQKRVIASIAQARRSEHSERLLERSFDLVIVDEAHHLRDRLSQSYKLVDGLNKRFLLLLSATPVQNDLTELYNLLTLLKPGIFKTLKEFDAQRDDPQYPRGCGVEAAAAPCRHDPRRWRCRRARGLPRACSSGARPRCRQGGPASPCAAAPPGRGGIIAGGCRRRRESLRARPLRCIGLAGAGAALERACGRRQGGRASRSATPQSRGKETGVRPLP